MALVHGWLLAWQTPSDAVAWSSQAEKLGIIGILFLGFGVFVVAMIRGWLVPGWMYRQKHEEAVMYRSAYMDLRGTARDLRDIAKSAAEKAAGM